MIKSCGLSPGILVKSSTHPFLCWKFNPSISLHIFVVYWLKFWSWAHQLNGWGRVYHSFWIFSRHKTMTKSRDTKMKRSNVTIFPWDWPHNACYHNIILIPFGKKTEDPFTEGPSDLHCLCIKDEDEKGWWALMWFQGGPTLSCLQFGQLDIGEN